MVLHKAEFYEKKYIKKIDTLFAIFKKTLF